MWKIGFKVGEEEVGEMTVNVDECSPKEHYLYLYNEFKIEEDDQIDEEGNVVEIEPQVMAKVMGVFPPTTWVYALQDGILVYPEGEIPEGE
jgi:hypothetical protein